MCFRAGLLAAIRAKTHGGLAGVMVTASHNPKQDNGLKIFDRNGDMLEASWEALAEDFVNTKDIAGFLKELWLNGSVEGATFKGKVGGDILSPGSFVVIGMDTRDSSRRLLDAVSHGISLIGSQPVNFGEVTTPQLHWLTQKYNQLKETEPLAYQKIRSTDFNEAWAHYFHDFSQLLGDAKNTRYQPTLLLDCANGVGAPQFKITYGKLQELFGGSLPLQVKIINDDAKPDNLNEGCGAEYVHKDQKFPLQFSAGVGEKCASFDGDADRLIYFYKGKEGDTTPTIIDGDK